MTGLRYARVQTDVNCQLRRGAWYRVLRLAAREAVLDVNHQQLPVPRQLLQIVPTPPRRWTVVPLPRDARRVPANWGGEYAVCPSCRHRAPVATEAPRMRCARCNGLFDIGWDERYLRQD